MIPFIGLTGGIACGKSTASAQFASLGVPVVDADDVGHTLYEPGGKAVRFIKREFGAEFVAANGAVDRDLLRSVVFRDPLVRKRLEAVTHPLIRKECLRLMSEAQGIYGLLMAPLLLESDFITEALEKILVIDCDPEIQMEHALERGRFTREQINGAIKAQMPREVRNERADDIILNNGDLEHLARAVSDLHVKYVDLFAGR